MKDYYDKRQPVYYVFQVMQVLYLLGFLAHLVLILNATVVHSHTYQNNNGPLYSERAVSMYWFALVFSVCRMFLFITASSLLLYRKTQCCCGKPGNKGCSVFWTGLLIVCVCIDVFVLAVLGSYFHQCNVPGNANNPCNDLRYCHVPDVYNVFASGCTYTTPWNPPVTLDQLRSNVDFRWLFATSVVFVAFDLVFLFVPLGQWIEFSSKTTKEEQDDYEDCEDVDYDVLEDETAPLLNRVNATLEQRNMRKRAARHGIKK